MREHEVTLWPPSFDAAIFDFDGTLAFTGWIWERVDRMFFERRGLPYEPSVHQTLAMLGFHGGAEWCIERYGLTDSVEAICDEWERTSSELYATEVRLRPGAAEYLAALREKGTPIALATTNDPHVLNSMRANVDVYALFDEVVCGKEVARPKDHPDIYLEAARRLGTAPEGCLVFEDILAGIRSSGSAGMQTCAVRCDDDRQPVETLKAEADLMIDGWEELL